MKALLDLVVSLHFDDCIGVFESGGESWTIFLNIIVGFVNNFVKVFLLRNVALIAFISCNIRSFSLADLAIFSLFSLL